MVLWTCAIFLPHDFYESMSSTIFTSPETSTLKYILRKAHKERCSMDALIAGARYVSVADLDKLSQLCETMLGLQVFFDTTDVLDLFLEVWFYLTSDQQRYLAGKFPRDELALHLVRCKQFPSIDDVLHLSETLKPLPDTEV